MSVNRSVTVPWGNDTSEHMRSTIAVTLRLVLVKVRSCARERSALLVVGFLILIGPPSYFFVVDSRLATKRDSDSWAARRRR
jgi:hypothetical protein